MKENKLNRYDIIALIRTRLNYLNRRSKKQEHCKEYLRQVKVLTAQLAKEI